METRQLSGLARQDDLEYITFSGAPLHPDRRRPRRRRAQPVRERAGRHRRRRRPLLLLLLLLPPLPPGAQHLRLRGLPRRRLGEERGAEEVPQGGLLREGVRERHRGRGRGDQGLREAQVGEKNGKYHHI